MLLDDHLVSLFVPVHLLFVDDLEGDSLASGLDDRLDHVRIVAFAEHVACLKVVQSKDAADTGEAEPTDGLGELEGRRRGEGLGAEGRFAADRPPCPLHALALRPRQCRPEAAQELSARFRRARLAHRASLHFSYLLWNCLKEFCSIVMSVVRSPGVVSRWSLVVGTLEPQSPKPPIPTTNKITKATKVAKAKATKVVKVAEVSKIVKASKV
eukprot:scaffold54296_cov26-Tisochrysis_lutea.AAC.3